MGHMTDHLDAERLAAFADGSLTRAERAAVEAHAADCGPCLEMLAAMIRTEPPAQPSRWRPAIVLRWAVPAMVGATALALWVNVDRAPREEIAAPQTKIEAVPQESRAAPAEPLAPAPETRARSAADAANKSVPPPSSAAARDALQQRTVREEAEEQKLARKDAAAPTPGRAREGFADTAQQAAPTAPPAAGAAGSRRLAATASTIDVASSDASTRWRMRGGVLERTTDGGKTWETRAEALQGAWIAGASPAPDVVWFIGRGGDVLIYADGQAVRRRLPEGVDPVSVVVVNGREGVVSAVDGRAFATTDGGVTWTAR